VPESRRSVPAVPRVQNLYSYFINNFIKQIYNDIRPRLLEVAIFCATRISAIFPALLRPGRTSSSFFNGQQTALNPRPACFRSARRGPASRSTRKQGWWPAPTAGRAFSPDPRGS